MARVHRIKIWPIYYDLVLSGDKTFEVRLADRDYRVGDFLQLYSFDPVNRVYLGPYVWRRISFIQKIGQLAMLPMAEGEYVILAIHPKAPFLPADGPSEFIDPPDEPAPQLNKVSIAEAIKTSDAISDGDDGHV